MSAASNAPDSPTTPASPLDSPFEVLDQNIKQRTLRDKACMRLDERGNIYITKLLIQAMELGDGSRLKLLYHKDSPMDWFLFPVSSTDKSGYLIKLRRGKSKSSTATVDTLLEFGAVLNCKNLALKFFEMTGREPGTFSFYVVTTPEHHQVPGYPHHDKCFRILTTQPIS